MHLPKSDAGSAILEFITFVLIGQLMVFGGSIAISAQLSAKVELQLLASKVARGIALDRQVQVPTQVSLVHAVCPARLVCVRVQSGEQIVTSVSYR